MTDVVSDPSCGVFCYGEAMVLVAPLIPGPLSERPQCSLSPAGAEFNVAAHLAGLGCDVQWISALGKDPLADIILDEADRRGVGTSYVSLDPGHPTGIYLKSSEAGETRMLYYRKGSAAAAFDLVEGMSDVSTIPSIIHTTGITPALSPAARNSVEQLLEGKIFTGSTVSFDVNYRPALWGDVSASDVLLSVAQRSGIVFVGRDEAETVWGTSTADEIRRLIDRPRHLVVKDGAEKAIEFDGDIAVECSAPSVDVLEPVGAGDAFAAGWLAGYDRGLPSMSRLRLGHFMASQALQHHGDIFPSVSSNRVRDAVSTPVEKWSDSLVTRS